MKLGKFIIFFININLIFDNINRGIDRLSRFRGFCILLIKDKLAHPTKSVAELNQTPTILDRKRTECPLPHAVGF